MKVSPFKDKFCSPFPHRVYKRNKNILIANPQIVTYFLRNPANSKKIPNYILHLHTNLRSPIHHCSTKQRKTCHFLPQPVVVVDDSILYQSDGRLFLSFPESQQINQEKGILSDAFRRNRSTPKACKT